MIIVFRGHNDIISISFLIILVCADLKSNNKLYALYYKTITKKTQYFCLVFTLAWKLICTGCVDKPRAPFKSQYIQQYVLKSHQVWCQIKAWVLNFLGMSLDMKIRLKLSEICKET